ncbi:hypothetical protein [Mesorhizobium australicum]|uniref:hypothetical protein n=1 Tax=Mesorhizobium australicum TaxID=536018 RepID=UPI003336E83E
MKGVIALDNIRPLSFGGCLLNNLISALHQNNKLAGIYKEMGFLRTPFSISAASAVQLLDFITGSKTIPPHVRRFCYLDSSREPNKEQMAIPYTADLIIVEMSTSIDILYDGFVVNTNRFQEIILPELEHLNVPPRIVAKWRSSLVKQNESGRVKYAKQLLELVPPTEEFEWLHDLVGRTTTRQLNVDDMTTYIRRIKETLDVPLAVVHHNFRYMPDGRPISWPTELKDQSIEVAHRLKAHEMDFAPFVARHGVKRVLADDCRHWNPAFFPEIANHLYKFISRVAGRGTPEDLIERTFVPTELENDEPPQIPNKRQSPDKRLSETTSVEGREKHNSTDGREMPPKDAGELQPGTDGGILSADDLVYHPETASHFDFGSRVLNMILVVGQSWALGGNNDEAGDAPFTSVPEHPGRALMFDAGSAPRGRRVSKLVDLFERATGSTKETPCGGLADYLMRTCEGRFGKKPTMVFASVGRGGTTLSGLNQGSADGLLRGSAQHREAMRLVATAAKFARAEGKSVRVLAICLAHGESDAGRGTPGDTYQRGLILLRQQYDADIRRLTGQGSSVPMLTYQANRGASRPGIIAESVWSQLRVAKVDPHIRCIGPVYHHEPEMRSDGRSAHLKAIGYRRIGFQFGRFLLDDLFGPGLEPLRVSHVRLLRPNVIGLEYSRTITLELNDDRINVSNLGAGLGIDAVGMGAAGPTITSLAVSARDDKVLEIHLSSPISRSGGRLFIAARITGTNCGRHEGARSGIRAKVPYYVDPHDNSAMYDWACSEIVDVPYQ